MSDTLTRTRVPTEHDAYVDGLAAGLDWFFPKADPLTRETISDMAEEFASATPNRKEFKVLKGAWLLGFHDGLNGGSL